MNELSSVNTSFYPELAPGYAPKTLQAVVGIKNDQYSQRLDANSYVDESDYQKAEVNLNNYYAQTKIENFMAKAGTDLIASAERLDNSMVQAINNGYSVQDVCNIRLADIAYKASARAFEAAEEMSTFALDV